MDINTCFETTKDLHTVAYYTHLTPIFVSLFISFYLFFKTKHSLLSRIFLYFTFGFCMWLVYDIIAWTFKDYYLIHTTWALFDYTNTIFFLLGLYFYSVLILKRDVPVGWKWFGFLLTLPALYLVIIGDSIQGFNQSVCESNNNNFLVDYKNSLEAIIIVLTLCFGIKAYFSKNSADIKKSILVIGSALLLFFVVFSITDYISASTDYYEYGLYGLFVLPIFLGMIVYSIVKFNAFNVRLVGAQALIVTLLVLVGSKIFTVESGINQLITVFTIIAVCVFGYILIRSIKKEIETLEKVERLVKDLEKANVRLKELDQQKSEFISLASHQIRGPLAAIKGYVSMILEGDMGVIKDEMKKTMEIIYESAQSLVMLVGDFLDVSRIEQGRMKYEVADFNLKDLINTAVQEIAPTIKIENLKISFTEEKGGDYMVHADQGKVKQVVLNVIDNAIKYTKEGFIKVHLSRKNNKLNILVKDTGVGIKPEVLPKLFEKFTRAPDASKTNILGTGLGLYVAKKMIEGNGGKIWATSEGEGKGAEFHIEIDALHKEPLKAKAFAEDL